MSEAERNRKVGRSTPSTELEVVKMKYIIAANIGILISILALLGKTVWIA